MRSIHKNKTLKRINVFINVGAPVPDSEMYIPFGVGDDEMIEHCHQALLEHLYPEIERNHSVRGCKHFKK